MKCVSANGMQSQYVQHTHNKVCNVLLISYESLRATVTQYAKLLPSWQTEKLKTVNSLSESKKTNGYSGKVNK